MSSAPEYYQTDWEFWLGIASQSLPYTCRFLSLPFVFSAQLIRETSFFSSSTGSGHSIHLLHPAATLLPTAAPYPVDTWVRFFFVRSDLSQKKARNCNLKRVRTYLGSTGLYITKHVSKEWTRRGWSAEYVAHLIQQPAATREDIAEDNRYETGTPGAPCTVFWDEKGHYMVVHSETKEIIAISNRNDPSWIPDDDFRFQHIAQVHTRSTGYLIYEIPPF